MEIHINFNKINVAIVNDCKIYKYKFNLAIAN